jgi:dTDP-4-dehydrorhamnose 3,5-epimerase
MSTLKDLISIKQLKVHLDDRGWVYELLRSDDPQFIKYGQTYVSVINPEAVKGFHLHKKQTDNVACVIGDIKLVLVSKDRKEVLELYLGERNPILVTIPPGVWHAWKCITTYPATVVNTLTHLYFPDKPDEIREDPHKFILDIQTNDSQFYSWARKDK